MENISLDSVGKPGKRTGHQADNIPEFLQAKKTREENHSGEAGNWLVTSII